MALMITKNDINRVYGTPYTPAPKITKSDLDAVYGTPPSYTDIQRNALSYPVKQTKTNTQKYGTVNGKTVLPYSIENQGLYDLSKKSKFNYFADGYLEAIREESKKQLEQLEKRAYNIYIILVHMPPHL